MKPRALGDLGESIAQKVFPRWHLRRQPGSGNRWPRQEDLEGPGHLVQVKTTMGAAFMDAWLDLQTRARHESKRGVWVEVYVSPDERKAVIFERKFVGALDLGIGGG